MTNTTCLQYVINGNVWPNFQFCRHARWEENFWWPTKSCSLPMMKGWRNCLLRTTATSWCPSRPSASWHTKDPTLCDWVHVFRRIQRASRRIDQTVQDNHSMLMSYLSRKQNESLKHCFSKIKAPYRVLFYFFLLASSWTTFLFLMISSISESRSGEAPTFQQTLNNLQTNTL